MFLRAAIATLFVTSFLGTVEADTIRFARYPNISNDGRIAFSYHGDIWMAEADGSNGKRLTAHIAHDTFPRFSPDGKWIAFNSDRMGNSDVWIIDAQGGVPRQLTFHSTSDTVQYWTPDGSGVVIASARGAGAWGSPLYVASLDGRLPQPLPMDRGAAGMISQDGKRVAFNRGSFRYWRKHYRGNNNTDIWVQNLDDQQITQLTDLNLKEYREHTQDAYPMWGADGNIYFLSERGQAFNIWKISPQGGAATQVTFHKEDGIQYPSISPDGKQIIYENEFELWKLTIADGQPEKISVTLDFDSKDNPLEVLEVDSEAGDFSVSPDGEMIAIERHGEIFLVPADAETGEKTRVTHSAWRDQDVSFSPDGKSLAYLSDQSGEDEIWVYDLATQQHRQVSHHASIKSDLTWSPDSESIAFTADQKIFIIQISDGSTREVVANPEGGFRGVSFSKDGTFLIYSRSDENLNSEVYLFDIANGKETNVTDSRFSEFGNVITDDGKHVVFVSDRSGSFQIHAVSLRKLTEDPDDPLVKKKNQKKTAGKRDSKSGDGSKPDADSKHEESGKSAGGDPKAEKQEPAAADPITIDLDGIRDRARQLTSGTEDIRGFETSPDGKTIYFSKSNSLYAIDVEGGKERKIVDGSFSRIRVTRDGKLFHYRTGNNIYQMTVKGSGKKKIEFKLKFVVDRPSQWKQIFEESWRVMKYRFYDKDMHGYDWDAIKNRYQPMLKYVGENQDLYDLCNEMIGELNASHTGVSGPPTRTMPAVYETRHPGFELQDDGKYYRISHIYPHGPADKEWLDLSVGDVVLSIEGQSIRSGDNYYRHFNELLNDYVDIEVTTPQDGVVSIDKTRALRIRHISSVRNLKYKAWVEQNREFVSKHSSGKIGYVHIRSMNRTSLTQFEKEINQFWNKNGMVIDIRYNGGGNIDQELIDILERKPYEYWNYRLGGRAAGRRPRQAIAGPKVMLINWRSASDSEVTPQAFRDLKLGRIVGNPTYGAVIATSSYRLMGNARIRTPSSLVVTYDPTKPYNYGTNLENFGVAPDVWVENTPVDEKQGFDRELKTAVDEALKMLKEGDWQYGEDD